MKAIDFDHARNTTITELRGDFYTLFARYNALIRQIVSFARAVPLAKRAHARAG